MGSWSKFKFIKYFGRFYISMLSNLLLGGQKKRAFHFLVFTIILEVCTPRAGLGEVPLTLSGGTPPLLPPPLNFRKNNGNDVVHFCRTPQPPHSLLQPNLLLFLIFFWRMIFLIYSEICWVNMGSSPQMDHSPCLIHFIGCNLLVAFAIWRLMLLLHSVLIWF